MLGNAVICEDVREILSEDIGWDSLGGKAVMVTGANGFIPSYIVYALLELNDTRLRDNPASVLAVVRNREKALRKFAGFEPRGDFRLIVSDVSEPLRLDAKIDVIIHAASQASPKYYGVDPVGTLKANTLGTANMLELGRACGVGKFLYISSGEVYGALDGSLGAVTESYAGSVDVTDVRSCYAESKRMGENMCVCWARQYGFSANMLRLSHTYGPGVELNDGRVFADFVRNVVNGEDIALHSDGSAKRSFVYITDMVAGLFRVLFYGESGHAYNIAADEETGILELAEMLRGLYPEKGLSVRFSGGAAPAGYMRSASAGAALSAGKLKKLGWAPKVSLERGFRRMIESYNGAR
jgi:nucleoside-diphosphate-sugar epimerase